MPTTTERFVNTTASLRDELVGQGRRVQAMVDAAFEAIFLASSDRAAWVVAHDDIVDAVDVALERSCVELLTEATGSGAQLSESQLRLVLTIVKVNNELERTADVAVELAEMVLSSKVMAGNGGQCLPDTFRVMANSVLGIVRDVNSSVEQLDPALANIVLQSQHAVTAFKDAVLRSAEIKLARNEMTADFAFSLHEIATACEIIADHCSNIAEQVIYLTTGAVVRHGHSSWERVHSTKTAG